MNYYDSKVKIIYNPKDGAPITSFIYEGVQLSTHYPDGYELKNGEVPKGKGLVQYENDKAKAILETYAFLREVSPDEATAILAQPQNEEYVCDFPGCEFKTHTKVALAGHKRSHAKEQAKLNEPLVDPNEIPVASGEKVPTIMDRAIRTDIPNGRDKDGVEFYGEGVKIENHGIRKPGKGHFVG